MDPRPSHEPPTIWGLDPTALHDRFWAARGVQVVRAGDGGTPVSERAGFYLLTDARTLTLFPPHVLRDLSGRARPDVLLIRLRRRGGSGYQETPVTDGRGNLLRLRRSYEHRGTAATRAVLVRDPELARRWQRSADGRAAWRHLRRQWRVRRRVAEAKGRAFDRFSEHELAAFVTELVQHWHHPDATVPGVRRAGRHVWVHGSAHLDEGTRCVGPVWVGAGREVRGAQAILGPAALWDVPAARPVVGAVEWDTLRPEVAPPPPPPPAPRVPAAARALPRPRVTLARASKRAFDIAFALAALAATLPLFPLVMLAIWLEDGRPFFFGHKRETLGGREFPCLKFRSMCKDSERIKQHIAAHNQADGPQFFIKTDPRLTRVGRVIRKLNVDELPQFFNVLLGHMSVVGPRPSPYKENQFCPPWREARLSVRPGITGLWQVMRTRRQGQDFQEWIRYDLEYVRHAGWRLDLWIIWKTVVMILFGNGAH